MEMESARSCEESVRSRFVSEAYNHFVCFVSVQTQWPINKYVFVISSTIWRFDKH